MRADTNTPATINTTFINNRRTPPANPYGFRWALFDACCAAFALVFNKGN